VAITVCVVCPLVVAFGAFTAAMFDSGISSQVDEPLVFGEGDSGEVVVVTYEKRGDRNLLALPHWLVSGYDLRASAVSTATGEQLWDVSVEAWWPSGDAGPLAAGGGRAYVVGPMGLVVLDLADGSQVATSEEIDGLGSPVLRAQGAYAYDAASDQVVALTAEGDVRGIPVGSDSAGPVADDVVERWAQRLDTSQFLHDPDRGALTDGSGGPLGGEDPCADAGLCAVSPGGRVVEVDPYEVLDGDDLAGLLVAGVRVELGRQGLPW